MEYNQVSITDPKTGEPKLYTVKEISWTRDMSIQTQNLNADHATVNQTEMWIARLHESIGLEDTELRKMDRRTFETLIAKWMLVNDVDQAAFLETKKTSKKE